MFHLLDSGALYRLTALSGIEKQCDLNDEATAVDLAKNLDIEFLIDDGVTRIMLRGQDVSDKIRLENVGMGASTVAAHPRVREALLQRQRDFCRPPGLVADGRDMGTVVFPNAALKIYLLASAEERARRRYLQLLAGSDSADFDKILADIRARDERDSSRAIAPLVAAKDAICIDSTGTSIDAVFAAVMAHLEKRIDYV